MSVDDQQWQRKNVEGALFLVRRRSHPRHQLVVLNKVSAANHAEDVRLGMELVRPNLLERLRLDDRNSIERIGRLRNRYVRD